MKETIIDMILQYFAGKNSTLGLPTPVSDLLDRLKKLKTITTDVPTTKDLLDHDCLDRQAPSLNASRVYCDQETKKLTRSGISLLILLENNQLLYPSDREKIIQIVMAHEDTIVDSDFLKQIILLVVGEHTPDKLRMNWLSYLLFHNEQRTKH